MWVMGELQFPPFEGAFPSWRSKKRHQTQIRGCTAGTPRLDDHSRPTSTSVLRQPDQQRRWERSSKRPTFQGVTQCCGAGTFDGRRIIRQKSERKLLTGIFERPISRPRRRRRTQTRLRSHGIVADLEKHTLVRTRVFRGTGQCRSFSS
jgi:hypothetical protein